MKFRLKKKYFFWALLILFVMYLFWGPLFPWNSVKPGYKKIKSSKATIFISGFDKDRDRVAYNLDKIIREEEVFHGLEFKKNFRIIILGKESNMKRYLPWIKGSGYSVSLGFLNTIYIGPNARISPFGTEVFLKHEMSHLLIHQNTSSGRNNMEMLRQGWLTEGLASYFGGPHYYDKEHFVELWTKKGLQFNSLYMGNPHEMDRNTIRLKYTYYRFLIEFLIETYGLDKLQSYVKNYSENPENYEEIFLGIYNNHLNDLLRDFNTYMQS